MCISIWCPILRLTGYLGVHDGVPDVTAHRPIMPYVMHSVCRLARFGKGGWKCTTNHKPLQYRPQPLAQLRQGAKALELLQNSSTFSSPSLCLSPLPSRGRMTGGFIFLEPCFVSNSDREGVREGQRSRRWVAHRIILGNGPYQQYGPQ